MVDDLIETLNRLGVKVTLVAADRIRLEPASRIPLDLIPRIREAKSAILAALRQDHEPDAVGDAVRSMLKPGEYVDERGRIRKVQ